MKIRRTFRNALVRAWIAAAIVSFAHTAWAAPAELQRLFPLQATLEVESDGLARVMLPPEVLSACRPDLSDLRVFDATGREVAHLVDSDRGPNVAIEAKQTFDASVLSLSRDLSEPENEPPRHLEIYEIAAPPVDSETGRWDLIVRSQARRFVREISVETISSDGDVQPLLQSESLFWLDPTVSRTRIALDPFRAQRLRVTISGQDGFYLEPGFRFESSRLIGPLHQAVVDLVAASSTDGTAKTTLELERPGAIVPDALEIATTTGSFRRKVSVWDVQPGVPDVVLGSAVLYRVETGRGSDRVEQRSVPLRAARGSTLRVVIENGDSPPLTDVSAVALVRQPVLVFQLPNGQRSGVLRFGGGRAHRARYDLSGLLLGSRQTLSGEPARAALGLYDPDVLSMARLHSIGPNPDFDSSPALAFAMHPGAAIDVRLYEHARTLSIAPSAEGLSRLVLTPADVASARADLADIRVVDGDGQQWPYLVERSGPRTEIALDVEVMPRDDQTSVYRFALPDAPLPIERLGFATDAAYVHRPFQLFWLDADDELTQLSNGQLIKDARRPRPFSLGFRTTRAHGLELAIEDGDDAPLRIDRAFVRMRRPQLFLVAPAGRYALLIGRPEDTAPRYELERVRDVVLAVASNPVATGALDVNPAFSATARLGPDKGRLQQWAVWGVLLLAAGALLVLTLRIARQSPPTSPT